MQSAEGALSGTRLSLGATITAQPEGRDARRAMANRPTIATTESEAANLTLTELDNQIAMMEGSFQNASGPGPRRAAFTLLVWLEKCRERLHSLPAPRRHLHDNDSE